MQARPSTLFLLLLLVAPVTLHAQGRTGCPVAEPGMVVVYGDLPAPGRVPAADLRGMPRVAFHGQFTDGRPADFEGVRLWDLLVRAGLADSLRSGDLTRYIVVEAADGYRAAFALAELHGSFRAEPPLLADRQDGAAIREGFGPLQVVVPTELRQSRWVRQVECLRLLRAPA